MISVVALFALFRLASWEGLSAAFSQVRLLNLAGAVLLTVLSLMTRARSWQILLNHRTTLRQAFFIINEGYLLNNLFPLRAGELGRAVFMGQASRLGPFHVLSTIIIERAFDLAMAAILLLTTLPLALGMDWARPVAIVTLIAVAIGLGVLYWMARSQEKVKVIVEKLGRRWPVIERLAAPRIGSLLDGLSALTSPAAFLSSLFWIAASWAMWVLIYYIMLIPIVPEAKLWWAAFADGVLALGIAVPSAPGALGVFEAALVGALTLLGVPTSSALAYAILMHFVQFVSTGLLGLWGLFSERRSLKGLFSEIHAGKDAA